MKRLALLTVFFYVCTFAVPQRAQAVAPVVLIAAAAVGASMMSASVGTYYAQNGVLPEYVSATAGAVASAADAIFQPSYLAQGAFQLFTPESLNTAKSYYVGKIASVGATVGDIVSFASSYYGAKFADLFSTIENSSSSAYDPSKELQANDTFVNPFGGFRKIVAFITTTDIPVSDWYESTYNKWVPGYENEIRISSSSGYIYVRTSNVTYKDSQNRLCYPGRVYNTTSVSSDYNPFDSPFASSVNYENLKDNLLQNMTAGLAQDIQEVIKELPDSKRLISAQQAPETVDTADSPPAITQADIDAALAANTAAVAQAIGAASDAQIAAAQAILEANTEAVNQAATNIAAATNPEEYAAQIAAAQNVLKANTSAVANAAATIAAASSSASAAQVSAAQDALKANTAAVTQAASAVASTVAIANPTDAAAQVAAAQVAIEAAQATEAANQPEPEPEPEPSYPVPSTWYTKTCDLSNGLGSCIDYQQVINATSAFQSTALYQFPNLILQCLGYVEGDGCEYPPKISVNLFTRFSTGPINVDLSPFESVVKVMKFFFSILCLVGTGKATMTLFE